MMRLKESAHGKSKSENAQLIKEKLEALNNKIPGLNKLEIGIDFSKGNDSGDIALYSEFSSKEALAEYQKHPEHTAIVPFIKEAREEGSVVDYII